MTSLALLGAAASQRFAGKNRIINGACTVNQRGTASAIYNGGTVYGGPDRFAFATGVATSGALSLAQNTANVFNSPAFVATVTTPFANTGAAGLWGIVVQRIEGLNSYDLIGQPITVSFLFASNVTGTFSAAITDQGGNAYLYNFTYSTATAAQRVTFTAPANSGLVIPMSVGAGLVLRIGAYGDNSAGSSALNQWTTGALYSTGLTNWMNAVNNYIAFTNVQVEAGNIATTFERESFAHTLAKCQRYYQTSYFQIGSAVTSSGNVTCNAIPFATVMRATPSVSTSGLSFSSSVSGCTLSAASAAAITAYFTATAAINSGWASGTYAASAEL